MNNEINLEGNLRLLISDNIYTNIYENNYTERCDFTTKMILFMFTLDEDKYDMIYNYIQKIYPEAKQYQGKNNYLEMMEHVYNTISETHSFIQLIKRNELITQIYNVDNK